MLIFADSFDDYNVVLQRWSTNIGASTIDLTGTHSRTGIGAIALSGQGPQKFFTPRTGLVAGVAYQPAGLNNMIIIFNYGGAHQMRCQLNSDGSVSILADSLTILGTTVPGLLQAGVYAYVEMKCPIFSTTIGEVILRVNGQQRLHLTGINNDPAGTGGANELEIQGPGGGTTCYVDDIYLCDLTPAAHGPPNNDFLGAIRNYTFTPTADGAPLQWTPSTGTTHYNLVNEVPPDGDTSYVFDNNPGDVDMEVFTPSGIPAPNTIYAVQHSLCAKLDAAGSRTITSAVNGVQQGSGQALTTTYTDVLTQMDYNPATLLQWTGTDFPGTQLGPIVVT